MNKKQKVFLALAIGSLSILFLWSLVTFIFSKTEGIVLNTQYIPLPFAFLGIVFVIIFSIQFWKCNYSNFIKINIILSLIFFACSTISATVFILLIYNDWYNVYKLHKLHTSIAIIVPTIFLVATVVCAILCLKSNISRRPTKAERLEQRIAELEQQVDELKKGE